MLSACQSNPLIIDQWHQGLLFQHAVIHHQPKDILLSKEKTLYIFIEGDGKPWKNYRQIALDPTSKEHLMVNLMLKTPYQSIYIGRPCYHQT